MPPAPSLAQIQALYTTTINTAQRFTSYNFHAYFVRRTEDVFRPVLAALSPPPGATPVGAPDPKDLARFYADRQAELAVMRRASEVNRMYEGPKLVVEHARPIEGGGGAGMEASAGGGGQPMDPGNPNEK